MNSDGATNRPPSNNQFDEIFAGIGFVLPIEKRLILRKLQKISTGQSSIYATVYRRDGSVLTLHMLAWRLSMLSGYFVLFAVSISLIFLHGTRLAWPIYSCFVFVVYFLGVGGVRMHRLSKARKSIRATNLGDLDANKD